MKTLQDVATEEEIDYLISNQLITEEHKTIPAEIREISGKATEIEFKDGLLVTIYDAVEPTAEWL